MFKSGLKIRTKLVMSAIVLCVCLAATLVGAALWILDHGVRRQADVFASTTLSTYSERIRVDLSRSIVAVRTVAAAVEALVGAGIVDRDVMGALARRLVRDNPQLVGMTLAFEPNALDGRDADFVGHAFSDAAGRFAPYFF